MATRYYKVHLAVNVNEEAKGPKPVTVERTFLVDATTGSQAERFVAQKFITSAIAKPQDIIEFMQTGAKPEKAGE